MSKFIDEHLFCGFCNKKVTKGEVHNCEFFGIYTIHDSKTYWCAWCQSYAEPVSNYNKTTCSNCGKNLHGGTASHIHNAMHDPIGDSEWVPLGTHDDPKAVSILEKNNKENIKHESNMRSLYVSDSRPNNFWLGRNTQQHTSTGSYHSSPYYKSSETYIQRYDNPIRNSSTYDNDNAWDNLSAYIYDITH